jgi:hypothetical protein
MRTLDDLPVVDSTGYPVDIGSEVDGGNGVTGGIVDLVAASEKPLSGGPWDPGIRAGLDLLIEWPDRDCLEVCLTQLAFAGGYAVLLCPEITSIDSPEAPDENDDAREIYDCGN